MTLYLAIKENIGGLVNYYAMAQNLARLGYVRWVMETSLLKTLAGKNKTTVMSEWKRLSQHRRRPTAHAYA